MYNMLFSTPVRYLSVSPSVVQRVPLIKFRGGSSGTSSSPPKEVAKPPVKPIKKTLPVIEDYQLPLKYRRSVINEKEIDAINTGCSLH